MSNEDLEKRIIAVMEFHGWKLLGNGRGQYMRPKVDGLNCPMLLSVLKYLSTLIITPHTIGSCQYGRSLEP